MSTANNNRIAITQPSGATWTYDAGGDVTFDGLNDYLYDGEGRICAVEQAFSPFSKFGYLYDVSGDRIAKGTLTSFSCNLSTNGFALTNSYVVDKDGQQLTEFQGTTPVHTNVFAGGRLLATYSNSNIYFTFTDWLGTKRAEIANNCSSTYASLPYGDELTPHGTCPDATEHHFTGKEHDTESGNDDFLARFYASAAGRFASPDSMTGKATDPQSLNKYAYVSNNPLTLTDPTGMNFGLPCNGGYDDSMCHGGLQGSWMEDENGNTQFVPISIDTAADGTLQDLSANQTGSYTASFDGSNVSITNSNGDTENGTWLHGTAEVDGVRGGGGLSDKCSFNFFDHGNGQSLNATFSYSGTYSELRNELSHVGYSQSVKDDLWNLREAVTNPTAANFRSPGEPGSGANSGHFLVDRSLLSMFPAFSVPTTGSVHTGETNPWISPQAAQQHLENEQ